MFGNEWLSAYFCSEKSTCGMKGYSIISTLAATMLFSTNSVASITLPDIISSHMVVEQNADARLWGWASPGSEIKASGSWNPQREVTTVTDNKGRWQLELPTPEASFTPYTITITGDGSDITLSDVLSGEVWFCSGQSNMEMPLRGFWGQPVEGAGQAIAYSGKRNYIRMANVPKRAAYEPRDRVEGKWEVSSPTTTPNFSALAYFFACSLSDLLDVPVGIINCAYGGSKLEGWQPKEQLDKYPEWDMAAEQKNPKLNEWERIGVMYNAMLLPVAGYTVKGFLWNQGESNVGRHATYPSHQKDMVEHWRKLWGNNELPFYFVELPGWDYGNPEGIDAAVFRLCQHEAADMLPNSGIVSTTDLVAPYEMTDVHASRKREIGERLAWMAGARTYGIEGLPAEYPTFRDMEVNGPVALLNFDNAPEGLTPNSRIEGFEVAGADGRYYPAVASELLDTRQIKVYAPEVAEIKNVRYNFKNFGRGRVTNLLGLPLLPFATDRPKSAE